MESRFPPTHTRFNRLSHISSSKGDIKMIDNLLEQLAEFGILLSKSSNEATYYIYGATAVVKFDEDGVNPLSIHFAK